MSTYDQVIYENELVDKRWEKLQQVASKHRNETSSSFSKNCTRFELLNEMRLLRLQVVMERCMVYIF